MSLGPVVDITVHISLDFDHRSHGFNIRYRSNRTSTICYLFLSNYGHQ